MGLDVPEMEKAYRPWTERTESGRREDYGTSGESYSDWWGTKPEAWQNSSTVGPTRAAMIRDELIRYEDIVDRRTGDLLTIKNIKSKFNI